MENCKSNHKIFQSLKDFNKYIQINKTKEPILYECSVFERKKSRNTNARIKFLRLHESFMLLSKVIFFLKKPQIKYNFRVNLSFI